MTFAEAYAEAVADALDAVSGDVDLEQLRDDKVAFRRVKRNFRVWCIGWNLSIVGALKSAEQRGKAAANQWNAEFTYGKKRRW